MEGGARRWHPDVADLSVHRAADDAWCGRDRIRPADRRRGARLRPDHRHDRRRSRHLYDHARAGDDHGLRRPVRCRGLLPHAALRDGRDLAEGPRGSAPRQHLLSAARSDLRAVGQGMELSLHRALLRGPQGRLLEFGEDHGTERHRLDRRRGGQRLRALQLALPRVGILLHDPAGRRPSFPIR